MNEHAFNQLVIAADPSFLGRLREHLGAAPEKTLAQTINKNWAQHSRRDIEKLLAKR